MQWISNAREMRELDRSAIGERGIPSTRLMEAAARAVAEEAAALADENRRAAVFCGSGNNGGDGVAAARFLLERGVSVRCFLVGGRDKLTTDTAEMERRLGAAGGVLEAFDPADPEQTAWARGAGVLVDALFGIGLTRPVTGAFRAAIEWMNASPAPTLAVDLPRKGSTVGLCDMAGKLLQCRKLPDQDNMVAAIAQALEEVSPEHRQVLVMREINGLSYEEIARRGGGILNSADLLHETSEEELYAQAMERVREIAAKGTGCVEIKSGYGLTTEDELKMLRVIRRIRETAPYLPCRHRRHRGTGLGRDAVSYV